MEGGNRELILIGGGGHALVVAEAAFDAGWTPVGFYDDRADAPLASLVKHLGSISTAGTALNTVAPVILVVGDLAARVALLERFGQRGWTRVRHPSAQVSRRTEIGVGVYLGARCVVNIRAAIGDHAIINTGAIVEHECQIGRNAHIAPGAVLCGRVRIGPNTLIGAGARVIPGITIGSGCTIGAGAVVVRDVPDNTTVVGVPAKPIN